MRLAKREKKISIREKDAQETDNHVIPRTQNSMVTELLLRALASYNFLFLGFVTFYVVVKRCIDADIDVDGALMLLPSISIACSQSLNRAISG